MLVILSALQYAVAMTSETPSTSAAFDKNGAYSISINSVAWYTSPDTQTVCEKGVQTVLPFKRKHPASGSDKFS